MKFIFSLFLFTSISFAQTELHHFEISNDIIWYDVNGHVIVYDSSEKTFTSETSFMDAEQIIIDGVSYPYNSNKIELGGVIYKFKSPFFGNAVYLRNMNGDKNLIMFRTSPMDRNAYQKFYKENWSAIDDQNRKILLEWAQHKQVEYAFNVTYGSNQNKD